MGSPSRAWRIMPRHSVATLKTHLLRRLRKPVCSAHRILTVTVAWTAMMCCCATSVASIEMIVNRVTGEFFLENTGVSSELFDGYSVDSPGSTLLPGNWTSIADNYDFSDGGLLDPNFDWFNLSMTMGSLAEASPSALSATLLSGQVVSLGKIWDTAEAEDLTGMVSMGASTSAIVVEFRTVYGDYNSDLVVDQLDHAVFVSTFGSVIDLRADGNMNGVVDASDYNIWRDSYELAMAPSASEFAGASVPEPTSFALLFTSAMLWCNRRRTSR